MNSRKEKLNSLILFFLALISHLPFLWAGYGKEEDAWAQALNARIIWETGVYEVSRLPGHPIYEFLLAGLWPIQHSYFFFNSLSAIATALAVMFFFRIATRLDLKNPFTLSLAFAFVPVFYIAGHYTIDYNFALCFLLASFLLLLEKKYIWAGILIGIATGFRISSSGFLVALPLLLLSRDLNLKPWIKFWVAGLAVSIIAFLPPLFTYGLAFLDFHKPPFPGWANVHYKLTLAVWGLPLLLLIFWLILKVLSRKEKRFRLQEDLISERRLWLGTFFIFFMQMSVFARLPFKAEFFIPAVPFLLMLLAVYLRRYQVRLLAGAAVVSSFLLGFDYADPYRGGTPSPLAITFQAGGKEIFLDPLQGPAILDYQKRQNKSQLVEEVLQWEKQRQEKAWVIAGWYWPEIMLKTDEDSLVKFDYYSTEEELQQAQEAGREIFYLPEMDEVNAKLQAHYLADSLGKPLP